MVNESSVTMKATALLLCLCLSLRLGVAQKYFISAAWFRDRFTFYEWEEALTNFTKIGGDTVLRQGPHVMLKSKVDLDNDPDFSNCLDRHDPSRLLTKCTDDAIKDMETQGLQVVSMASYKYHQNYSDVILACPNYDKKIINSKVYHRIILPVQNVEDPCNLPNNSEVVVLFTVSTGVDPNDLLMKAASLKNVSVYLGLPAAPVNSNGIIDNTFILANTFWSARVIKDYTERYGQSQKFLGYYSSDLCSLANENNSGYLRIYSELDAIIRPLKKKLAISVGIDMRKISGSTVSKHAYLFEGIVNASRADVIIVQEGRGSGNAGYYWPTQNTMPIKKLDEILYNVLLRQFPQMPENTIFDDVFDSSIQTVLEALFATKNRLTRTPFDMWLGIDAYENLTDDVCKDTTGSGVSLDRATKNRLDLSISGGGAVVQKIAAYAWDPDFTCKTSHHSKTLAEEIAADAGRPIVSHCSFHSEANQSVVVIGYNLVNGGPQGYNIEWRDIYNKEHSYEVSGYYFEADYGYEHHLVPSLIYTQLYDPPYNQEASQKGHIKVQAVGSSHACIFKYDYSGKN